MNNELIARGQQVKDGMVQTPEPFARNDYADTEQVVAEEPLSEPTLRLIQINPVSDPRWERFVESHPKALIFHHPAWIEVLEREYGRPCIGLACEDDQGTLLGVLPLSKTRGLPLLGRDSNTGARVSSLPRTPVAGPLSTSPEAMATLLRAAISLVDQSSERCQLQVKTANDGLESLVRGITKRSWRPTYALYLPEERLRFETETSDGLEECSAQYGPCDECRVLRFGSSKNHLRIRCSVNKAARAGIRIEDASTEEDLCVWYRIYLETMRRIAVPPRSYRLFQSLWELLRPRGLMRLVLAKLSTGRDERIVAGTIFLTFKQRVFYGFTACRKQDFAFSANDAIHWHVIHEACRRGFQVYDFGEVPEDHSGLAHFKRKWNAKEEALCRYYYPAPPESPRGGTGVSVFEVAGRAVWRRLPLRATEFMGDRIYGWL